MPRYHHFTPEEIALLGTMSDTKIAEILGLSRSAVERARAKYKVKSARSQGLVKRPDARASHLRMARIFNSQNILLLGTMYDAEFARRFNCSRERVRAKRKSLGIPKYRKNNT